jgi:hypothetical protein
MIAQVQDLYRQSNVISHEIQSLKQKLIQTGLGGDDILRELDSLERKTRLAIESVVASHVFGDPVRVR